MNNCVKLKEAIIANELEKFPVSPCPRENGESIMIPGNLYAWTEHCDNCEGGGIYKEME